MKSKLIPKTVPVAVGGRQFVIKPFGFGQYPAVGEHLLPLTDALEGAMAGQRLNLASLLASGGRGLMDVLALAITPKKAERELDPDFDPREFIDDLGFDDGKALLSAVIEANREQLSKKLIPLFVKWAGAAAAKSPAQAQTEQTEQPTASASTTSSEN